MTDTYRNQRDIHAACLHPQEACKYRRQTSCCTLSLYLYSCRLQVLAHVLMHTCASWGLFSSQVCMKATDVFSCSFFSGVRNNAVIWKSVNYQIIRHAFTFKILFYWHVAGLRYPNSTAGASKHSPITYHNVIHYVELVNLSWKTIGSLFGLHILWHIKLTFHSNPS